MKMTTKLPFISLLFVISTAVSAQTAYNYARLKGERLDRGVVAFRTSGDSVCIQWRYLPTDPQAVKARLDAELLRFFIAAKDLLPPGH